MSAREPDAVMIDPRTGSAYELLPTGKPHMSFSELRDHQDCSYRHKLKYVDKLGMSLPGVHLDFGTAIHSACERFLRTKEIDKKAFLTDFHNMWAEHAKVAPTQFTPEAFKQFATEGLGILPDVPFWFDETFPGWKFVDAEHYLYEPLEKWPHAFKGFIDCIIMAPGKRGKELTWLLDFKTCSWGWPGAKRSDPYVQAQLVLYKNFWTKKTNTCIKDVRCGFVLLKRAAKPGKHCELVTTSVGDVTIGKSLKVVDDMVSCVKRGIARKNRQSCKFCEFKDTPHCP